MGKHYPDQLPEKEELLHCSTCFQNSEHYSSERAPHRQPRYWIITLFLHLSAFLIVLGCVLTFNQPRNESKHQPTLKSEQAQTQSVVHMAHLIGTPLGSSPNAFHGELYHMITKFPHS
jgi:hypothetical protein